MQIKNLLILFLLVLASCKNNSKQQDVKFDKTKWAQTNGQEYLYRDRMLNDLINNYKLHGLKKDQVVNILGQPNRSQNGHLYYTVSQKFIGNTSWPLSTKTLVIKLTKDSTVEWRKIHQ